MNKAAIVFRIVDDYLYNAGLLLALLIIMAGVLLCLMAVLPRPGQGRSVPRFLSLELEEAAFHDESPAHRS